MIKREREREMRDETHAAVLDESKVSGTRIEVRVELASVKEVWTQASDLGCGSATSAYDPGAR